MRRWTDKFLTVLSTTPQSIDTLTSSTKESSVKTLRAVWPLLLVLSLTLVACPESPDTPAPTTPSEPSAPDGDAGVAPDTGDAGTAPDADEGPLDPVEDPSLVQEGVEVLPQTTLHLQANDGGCDEMATMVEWTVVQPVGSQGIFLPNALVETPSFIANAAGDYTFTLVVFGQNGLPCGPPRTLTVSVVPGPGLHIELLWHNAEDEDETDEGPAAGADLDLHLQRLFDDDPTPGWFEQPFDCYWFNPNPNWGSFDPVVDDDPSLDLDDTDGAGPENLNLTAPEDGVSYAVMAHHWSDHGYGEAQVTLRIFVDGSLLHEGTDVILAQMQGWEVGVLSWPDATFTPYADEDGDAKILDDIGPLSF
jgi:hypothetical protein